MRALLTAVAATALTLGIAPAADAARPAYKVSVGVSASTITLGDSITIKGRVSPNAKGKRVKIQRKYAAGSWKTIATKRLSSSSRYAVRIKPTTGGPTRYRVIKASSSTRGTGTSSTRTVNVWRWRHLADIPRIGPDAAVTRTVVLNGNAFPKSIATPVLSSSTPSWDYRASRCTKFRGYIGVEDSAPSDTVLYSQLLLDFPEPGYTMLSEDTVKHGENPHYVQEPLSSTNRILQPLGGASSSSLDNVSRVVATPRLYCNS